MQTDSQGWICLHRKLLDHPRFSQHGWLPVWVHLLISATHKPIRQRFAGQIVNLQPGQLITSKRKIAEELGLHPSLVGRILDTLKIESQIETRTSNVGSLFTITNWHLYQDREPQNEPRLNHQRTTNFLQNSESPLFAGSPLGCTVPDNNETMKQEEVHTHALGTSTPPVASKNQKACSCLGNGKAANRANSALQEKLLGLYHRESNQPWTYFEQSLFHELTKRPSFPDELDLLLEFWRGMRQEDRRYFPQSLSRLLESWSETLDRARRKPDMKARPAYIDEGAVQREMNKMRMLRP